MSAPPIQPSPVHPDPPPYTFLSLEKMNSLPEILDRLDEINSMKKTIKAEEDTLKSELQSLYDLGEIERKVSQNGVTASLTRTTTYKHSQEAREDIARIKNYDIELGHATLNETFSWTVRVDKKAAANG